MRKVYLSLLLCLTSIATASTATQIYHYKLKTIDGAPTTLAPYHGKVLLLVNVASSCGFTPQYAEIKKFCDRKYHVTFPMMSKVSVKGDDQTPLYRYLTSKTDDPKFGGDIQWNFTKFLIARNGTPIRRFEPAVTPDSPQVTAAIEAALQ
jgi:glutathione peroxidase